ncbi:MAG TPA: nitrophenyl compound nitroreductase subunit ArsF family protein [Phycisphaerae bacterium]|nr:nitrophenyl compound nitroreductase subunit ArsF family protein [Phycisphaerae bacterium]HNU43719.1 nitrophenyl compound nitroreductase subunit ArsF family protein [Phycisphaerae bacterium]
MPASAVFRVLLTAFSLLTLGGACERRTPHVSGARGAHDAALMASTAPEPAPERGPDPVVGPQASATPEAPPASMGAGQLSAAPVSAAVSASAVTSPPPAAPQPPAEPAPVPVPTAGETPTRRDPVMAYYFHRTLRCATCLSIEEQARQAIETGFAKELASGRLAWLVVNIAQNGNRHFEGDFALETQTLLLAEMKGDEVRRFVKLERVWELVEDPYEFERYVRREVAAFLGE